jgi:hypothetical protein
MPQARAAPRPTEVVKEGSLAGNRPHAVWVYPRVMAGKPAHRRGSQPAASPGSQPAEDERSAATTAAASSHERFGPLEFTRMVKPDGRALIVYARVEAPS